MVEKISIRQSQGTDHGPTGGVIGSEDDPPDPGMHQSRHAHGAGFKGDIKGGIGEAVVFQPGTRRPQYDYFSMGGRIMAGDGLVVADGDTYVLFDQYGTDRHFSQCPGPVGLLQGLLHPVVIDGVAVRFKGIRQTVGAGILPEPRNGRQPVSAYSHSMVAGGLPEMS
jgi:hypothetical protein